MVTRTLFAAEIGADIVLTVAYVAISVQMALFQCRFRWGLPAAMLSLMNLFQAFILLCGVSHMMMGLMTISAVLSDHMHVANLSVLIVMVAVKLLAAAVSAWAAVRLRPLVFKLWDQVADRIHRFSDLQSRHKALESVAEAQNAVVAHLSHEARGPLQIVQACLGFAAEDAGDLRGELRDRRCPHSVLSKTSAIRRDVRRAADATRSLTRLVDTVLDLSLLQAGLMRVRPEPVSLNDILDAAVSGASPLPGVIAVPIVGKPLGCISLGDRWPGSHISLGAASRHLVTDPQRLAVCISWAVESAAAFTTHGFIAVVATEGFAAPGQWFPVPDSDARPPGARDWQPSSTALPREAAAEYAAHIASTVPADVSVAEAPGPAPTIPTIPAAPAVVVDDQDPTSDRSTSAVGRASLDATMPGAGRANMFDVTEVDTSPESGSNVQVITDSTPHANPAGQGPDGSPGAVAHLGMGAAGGATPPGLREVMFGLHLDRDGLPPSSSPHATTGSVGAGTPSRGVHLAFRSPKASQVSPDVAAPSAGGNSSGPASVTAAQSRRRCIIIRVIDTGSRLDAITTESRVGQSRAHSNGSGAAAKAHDGVSEGTTADDDDDDDDDSADDEANRNRAGLGDSDAKTGPRRTDSRAGSIIDRLQSRDVLSALGVRPTKTPSSRATQARSPSLVGHRASSLLSGPVDSVASDTIQQSKTATAMHRTSGLGLDRVQRIAALLGCGVRQLQADGQGAASLVAPLAPALRSAGAVLPETGAPPVAVFELWMPVDVVAHPSWAHRLEQLRRVSTARTGMAPISVGPSVAQPTAVSDRDREPSPTPVVVHPATASPLPPRTLQAPAAADVVVTGQRARAVSHEVDARHREPRRVSPTSRPASSRQAAATPSDVLAVHTAGVDFGHAVVAGPASTIAATPAGSSSSGVREKGVAGSPASRRSGRRASPGKGIPLGASVSAAGHVRRELAIGEDAPAQAVKRSASSPRPGFVATEQAESRSRSQSPPKAARAAAAATSGQRRSQSRDRAQRDARRAERKAERREAARRKRAAGVGAGLTVLFVDDDDSIRRTTVRMLQRLGAKVHVLHDGDRVEPWMDGEGRRVALDLVLTDILMPGLDGERLCQRLAARGIPCPVVAATGTTTPETLERLPSIGFAAVLRKPYTAKDLAKVITKVKDGLLGPPLAPDAP